MNQPARKLRIEVPGVPVAQPRPRATVLNGHARVYGAPAKHAIHTFKAALQLAAQAAGAEATYRPVEMRISLWFPRPKSLTFKTRPMPQMPCVKKPDWDNCGKAVSDALNGIAYVDDSQIYRVEVSKFICAGGESPRCVVEISYGHSTPVAEQ